MRISTNQASRVRATVLSMPLLAVAVCVQAVVAETPAESFTFVQICDTQLGFGEDGYDRDVAAFRQAVEQVNAMRPDLVVICGDLVNSPKPDAYADFKSVLEQCTVPVHCTPGNHDIGNPLNAKYLKQYQATIGPDYFSLQHKGRTFAVVNTQLWKSPVEPETSRQDAWLQMVLKRASDASSPVFVVGHHPLFVTGVDEEELYYNLPPQRRRDLLDLFKTHGVVAVLTGHTHRFFENSHEGILMVGGETTSKNFDKRPRGFRLWTVGDQGTLGHEFVPLAGFEKVATFHVSPAGDDTWSGQLPDANSGATDGPFATLHRARDAIVESRRKANGPIDVILHGGEYHLETTLLLTPEAGGTEQGPVTWKAAPGERVAVRGTRKVTGWQPWERGIYRADLRQQGLDGAVFYQLFHQTTDGLAERQILARHPNFDPEHPWSGGNTYAAEMAAKPKQQLIYREDSLPFDSWADISQAEIVSTYNRGWQFAITPIESVDLESRTIHVRPVRGEFRKLNRFYVRNVLDALDAPGEWFLDRRTSMLYFYPPDGEIQGNVLVPVLDHLVHLAGTIPYPHGYLNTAWTRPRDEHPVDDSVPNNPVEWVRFEGITFEGARQDAIRMVGARNCSVVGCRVTNVGNVGINLGGITSSFHEVGNPRLTPAEGHAIGAGGGGQILLASDPAIDCRVEGCDVWATGCEGIMLCGTGNTADNNHVHEVGLYAKDCPCINLLGEENVASRNTLHDCPRCAVFIKGVDNIVELNDVHHTVRETCDMGAIRFVQRNPFLKGNIVRFNRVLATTGYGFKWSEAETFESPYYTWGIYLDDYTCGTTVFGNIVSGTGRGGIMIHGGGDNLVANNLVVNAGAYQIELAPMPTTRPGFETAFADNRIERNVLVAEGDRRAPIRWTRADPNQPTFRDNIVWSGPGVAPAILLQGSFGIRDWEGWLARGMDRGSVVADPMLIEEVIHADGNDRVCAYDLQKESPAWAKGFERIPVENIGCYESAARVSWPIEPNWRREREKPVLFSEPGRQPLGVTIEPFRILGPIHEGFETHSLGESPHSGDVADEPRARMLVTDQFAAEGRHSLEVNDASGLGQSYLPRIYWPFDFSEGEVMFGADFRLDPRMPAAFYIDCRQYSEVENREFLSGPMVRVTDDGRIMAQGDTLVTVPLGKWFCIEIRMSLGNSAGGESDVTIHVADAEPVGFRVKHTAVGFRRLERVVIASLSDEVARFHVDNIVCDRP